MYKPVQVAAPVLTPVSLEEARRHCRVEDDVTEDDGLIGALILAAVSYLDGWTGVLGRCLCQQTWRQDVGCFSSVMRLPIGPVIAVTGVVSYDGAGQTTTVAPASYTLLEDSRGPYVRFLSSYQGPDSTPEIGPAYALTFDAGYPDIPEVPADGEVPAIPARSSVPQALKQAILLLIGHWYENRETVALGVAPATLPLAFSALIAPFRRVKI
ncbi:head-tail connector protein [Rhizobium leguminosarum]|uniref:head-tail connector protein n=1 Tax=Rhizobium leguminosarum TaxID=384 RepID=UPI003F9C1859